MEHESRNNTIDLSNADTSSLSGILQTLWTLSKASITNRLPDAIATQASALAQSVFKVSEPTAKRYGELIGKGIFYLVNYGVEAKQAFDIGRDHWKGRKEILEAVGPYLDGKSLGSSQNEVIRQAYAKVFQNTKARSVGVGFGFAGSGINQLAAKKGINVAGASGDKGRDDASVVVGTLGTAAPALFGKWAENKLAENNKKTTTLDLILKVQEAANSGDVNTISFARRGNYMNLEEAILAIFKHHEELEGGPNIDSKWRQYDDLKHACREIAQSIKSGEVPPMALVDLIGNRRVLGTNGKVVDEEKIGMVLRDTAEAAVNHDPKQLQQMIDNLEMSLDEIRDTASMLYDHDPKVAGFFASLFPRAVLRKAGISKERLEQLQHISRDDLNDIFVEVMDHVAAMSADELHDHGLKPREAKELLQFARGFAANKDSMDDKDIEREVRGNTHIKTILSNMRPSSWKEFLQKEPAEHGRGEGDDEGREASHAARIAEEAARDGGHHKRKLSEKEIDGMKPYGARHPKKDLRHHAERDAGEAAYHNR